MINKQLEALSELAEIAPLFSEVNASSRTRELMKGEIPLKAFFTDADGDKKEKNE